MLKTKTITYHTVTTTCYEVTASENGVSVRCGTELLPVYTIERAKELRDALDEALDWLESQK